MYFSLIIPVFNRPDEIEEFLFSVTDLNFPYPFEVVIIEDGSTLPCDHIVAKFNEVLDIAYYSKPNSGPGDSRNYGMKRAKGDYFLIFDSDCILPPHYLLTVYRSLQEQYVDCFGGPDKAMDSFSDIQKAINFAMTSFITTGGIRGGSEAVDKFQPRSFNMGLSRHAFEAVGGFGNIHPGEDPDLAIRLWQVGHTTKLIPDAYVFHKRRISWNKFSVQVNKFGKARPILDSWYPQYAKPTYFLPSAFCVGFLFSLVLLLFGIPQLLGLYLIYFIFAFCLALYDTKNGKVALYSLVAIAIQFYGYGTGFAESYIKIRMLKRNPQNAFPQLFFKAQ